MATDELIDQDISPPDELANQRRRAPHSRLVDALLPLASLRLTVVLFALSIVLILAGTLAQVDKDIWEVMRLYFRTWIAWIDFQVFFPKSFFPGENGAGINVPGRFPFPGGWLIGTAMGINLLAAHTLRFKVQARGPRLLGGLAVIALGAALTAMVVIGGSGKDTIEGAAPIAWSTMWSVTRFTLLAVWAAGLYALYSLDHSRKIERWSLGVSLAALAGVLAVIFWRGESASLGDSSMRILWQLTKGGLAGLVLLAGCIMVFRKRAGIVLLHAGVALVMGNELLVHNLHVEGRMQIREGETVDYVYDVRKVELAVIDSSHAKTDDVVVVPESMLRETEAAKNLGVWETLLQKAGWSSQADANAERPVIDDSRLPFDVKIDQYLQNSTLEPVKPGEKNPATTGIGLETVAVERRAGTGTDAGGKVDMTAAYVTLTDRDSKKPLGTYLLDVVFPDTQKVTVGDKTYDIALRFKRTYKPYSMHLDDVRFDKYLGTQTAKNYSSDLQLVDPSQKVDRHVKIWMNNPLRFAGETFYQSDYYLERGTEGTVLQVVTNAGWMIPYVACMLVITGMLAQFAITLSRFLARRRDETLAQVAPVRKKGRLPVPTSQVSGWYFPVAIVLLAMMFVAYAATSKRTPIKDMKVDEFARLPIVHEGRIKPLDTVARNMLRYLSGGKQTFVDETGDKPITRPAIAWFLDVIARPDVAIKHKVFRIDNLELLEQLGLSKREGFRYSISEFSKHVGELVRQAELAAQRDPGQVSLYQKKVTELVRKMKAYRLLSISFEPPEVRPDHVEDDLMAAKHQLDSLKQMQAPLIVPPKEKDGEWEAFAVAWFDGLKDRAMGREPNPAMVEMTAMIVGYSKGDTNLFNSNLSVYQKLLAEHPPADLEETKVNFEEYFNAFNPFNLAAWLYFGAFVLVAISWLGWTQPLNRAAFCLLVFTLALHTFALASRIYISGRPPVTNLYSSAVFIGWGGVILGLILEMIYRLGIGNVIASVAGFSTLLIASFLAGLTDGDTLGVLQAVLDTQFWLATHVVCITLGYATTFIAGLLGILYILRGFFTSSLSPDVGKSLVRMIYGTVCFAMFFSFFGTVLGGLWADDSWGRFWGWDPKENGALIIVLWNALVLHARWGGMVKNRGLAALAVVGNIVTSWSWFGVNELGVGLHSYGFTEGVLMALGVFILTQLAIIGLAVLPKRMWASFRAA